MYTQGLLESTDTKDGASDRFEQHIARGQRVEASDTMPAAYRRLLLRQIAQHAHSEIIGMQPEGNWLTRAPTLKRKTILLAKIQDEAGHGMYLYSAAESLGETREQMVDQLMKGTAKYSSIFNYPTLTWADAVMIGWLIDGAAIMNQIPLCRCSYGPYARAMVRICREESFHQRQGFEAMEVLCSGSAEQKAMAQDALNRWWWPALMMFGPPDDMSIHSSQSTRWGVKRFSNDALRQRFIQALVPQAAHLNLQIPDPELRFDEASQQWVHGTIDWDEFNRVISGNGPCNAQRLRHLRDVHDAGAWVREAMEAYRVRLTQGDEQVELAA